MTDADLTKLFSNDYFEPLENNIKKLYVEYYLISNITQNIIVNLVKIGKREAAQYSFNYFSDSSRRLMSQNNSSTNQNITFSTWCTYKSICDNLISIIINKGMF